MRMSVSVLAYWVVSTVVVEYAENETKLELALLSGVSLCTLTVT
jgi:hypothetical protein